MISANSGLDGEVRLRPRVCGTLQTPTFKLSPEYEIHDDRSVPELLSGYFNFLQTHFDHILLFYIEYMQIALNH